MTDKDSQESNVASMNQHRNDQIIAQMDEANVAVAACETSLTKLELGSLREYVKDKRWRETGGVVFSINEKTKDSTDYALGRIAFHTLAKELVLSHESVYVTNLSNLVAAIDKAQALDEDVWLDQYQHLFVTNFYKSGEDSPLDATQVQRVHDFMEARWERGMFTHVQISGVKESTDIALSKWYGQAFWKWFKDVQVQFRF